MKFILDFEISYICCMCMSLVERPRIHMYNICKRWNVAIGMGLQQSGNDIIDKRTEYFDVDNLLKVFNIVYLQLKKHMLKIKIEIEYMLQYGMMKSTRIMLTSRFILVINGHQCL